MEEKIPVVNPEYASFWQRAGAFIIDSIVLALVLGILNGGRAGFGGDVGDDISMLEALVVIAYYVFMTSRYGATLGKMAIKIKVINANTMKNLTLGEAFIREVVGKFVSGLVFSLGYFWVAWDQKKQGWHDKIATSIVVKSEE